MKRALSALTLVMALPLLATAQDREVFVFTAGDAPEPIVAVFEVFHTEHLGDFWEVRVFAVGGETYRSPDAAAGPWWDPDFLAVGGFGVPWVLVIDPDSGDYLLFYRGEVVWEGEGRLVVTP